jgi:hypothetical protein
VLSFPLLANQLDVPFAIEDQPDGSPQGDARGGFADLNERVVAASVGSVESDVSQGALVS